MLHELYCYAINNGLVAKPGFKSKKIKAYVCLSVDGRFLGIDPEQVALCPDMGSAAQSAEKCNVFVEKRLIPLSDEKPKKKAFFIAALNDASKTNDKIKILIDVLQNKEKVKQINNALDSQKVKTGDIIGFKVDGIPLEQTIDIWWSRFRKTISSDKKQKDIKRCIITGELETPVSTVDKISGLRIVGGHSSGDAIICFDKDAFCSYGLKQAENSCVSETGIVAVNAALTELISKSPVLAGAKWIHWYKNKLEDYEIDCIDEIFGLEKTSEEPEEDDDLNTDAISAYTQANHLIESYKKGEKTSNLNNIYYILALSGAGGRVMVRTFEQGRYKDLQKNMNLWWEDLSLVMPNGIGNLKLPAIGKINFRLLKPQKSGKSVSERMKNELAGIEPRLVYAIINNNPLPDAIAVKALQYIRSKMLEGMEDSKIEPIPDKVCCQILKAWYLRKNKQGGIKMSLKCNPDYPEVAYQCGRMMAVYAAIQSRAMGNNLGAGIIQRYYTSASTSPALVFGRLSQLSQHHLVKIESQGAVIYYENLLSEIAQKIGQNIPKTLNLSQQAEFALGYYQQRAEMFKKKEQTTQEEE